jgi:phosphoribosylaminoimidazolecarboxamide formyltransferase / IMP cyclohydrolase
MALNIVNEVDGAVAVRHVIVSVSDKRGLDMLIPGLTEINPEVKIYSTGGSHQAIADLLGPAQATRHLVAVSDYTGQPEMQGGLVKTLDFKIYMGLLSETYNEPHARDLQRVGGVPFDMAVVNLYPFRQTVARAGVTPEEARTNIDIGGPCMVRASAKNFLRVAAVTDPDDYPALLSEMRAAGGTLTLATRARLAVKAFAMTSAYDRAIADFFSARSSSEIAAAYHVH